VNEVFSPPGTITGGGSQIVFSHTDNNSFMAVNRILEAGGRVNCALDDFSIGDRKYPRGTFVVNGESLKMDQLKAMASASRVPMRGGKVQVKMKELRKLRIALYTSWMASMDAGWISYIFDQYEFPYHVLRDAEVRAGGLSDRFDVIILPDQEVDSIVEGHRKGTMPPEYVGGINQAGVDNLKAFVEKGGMLICNKSSSDLPLRYFNLPIKNVLENVKSDSFSCPGSLLKVKYDTQNPLAFGLTENGMGYFSRDLAFETICDSTVGMERPTVIARYPDESLLISGWIIGEDSIRGKAAILDLPFGKGKIVLFGFNVQNRAQACSTFKLLLNALY